MNKILDSLIGTLDFREVAKSLVDMGFDKYEEYKNTIVKEREIRKQENEELRKLLSELTEKLKKYQ